MERLQPFDLVIFLALLAMFIVGYAQGVIRRLFGIGAMLFALILGAQLRQPLGQYLASQWTSIAPDYSYMVAFGAVFAAAAISLSIAIQITYHPAPLFHKYPALDEIVGGLLGVVEGFLILVAILLITDPYYTLDAFREHPGPGEFGLLRSLHGWLDPTLVVDVLRHSVIPVILAIFGVLFPPDVRRQLAQALTARH